MKKIYLVAVTFIMIAIGSASFTFFSEKDTYGTTYFEKIAQFKQSEHRLLRAIEQADLTNKENVKQIKLLISQSREKLKGLDFWFRYLEPIVYKKINGPLPIEWETEVFEKFERPYKREGAGLTLAALYLDEENPVKDSLKNLIRSSIEATQTYLADSITGQLKSYHHFYLCNRLLLLNLAAIYTTGFECPDPLYVIPELRVLLNDVAIVYHSFNKSFPVTPLSNRYLSLFTRAIEFSNNQSGDFTKFDHFTFIREYINPLFILNQQFIQNYKVRSNSLVDYSLNKSSLSIFSKELYFGQNAKGIYLRVVDPKVLAEIDRVGKLLFYDPVLSANNQRSCASCHKPTAYFTDTLLQTPLQYNKKEYLTRNTPTLINAVYNHLIMADGEHISLQNQTKAVLTNKLEMAANEREILERVLSCSDYKKVFSALLAYTPAEEEITLEHITSAVTFYYSKFSEYKAPFDDAINNKSVLPEDAKKGFNLFMSKAQCATCHFVPQFNGVKPPYIGSEFEVLGVPEDSSYSQLSDDVGRYRINPAKETRHAFRTGSLRNISYTAPYMHNGVFKTLNEVIDFYDAGGGIGKGLRVDNQTLSSDSLHLTDSEKKCLIIFFDSLNEQIVFEEAPFKLPLSKNKKLNLRKVGGEY
ncbi:MAG: cytochrome-c peroxidase [Chitinophagaceae bacterium]